MRPDPQAPFDPQALKRLDFSVQMRSFELELFWKRSVFFWGFIAAAFTGYAALRSLHSDLAIVVSCFGMVCAFAWALLNRGSKYWQESWTSRVEKYERPIVGELFAQEEPIQGWQGRWLQARRYSVSKLSIALSDYVFLVWLMVLVAETLHLNAPYTFPLWLKGLFLNLFVLLSLIYLGLMLKFCRSFRPKRNTSTNSN